MNKVELQWYTPEEVFKKATKTKAFQERYRAETTRIQLARTIREARANKKMTQGEVAKKASMPQSVVARIESGEHGISVETLARVAHALGKSVTIA